MGFLEMFKNKKRTKKVEFATPLQKQAMYKAGISFDDSTTKHEAMNKLKAFFAFATSEQKRQAFPRKYYRRPRWSEDDYAMDEHFHHPEGYF